MYLRGMFYRLSEFLQLTDQNSIIQRIKNTRITCPPMKCARFRCWHGFQISFIWLANSSAFSRFSWLKFSLAPSNQARTIKIASARSAGLSRLSVVIKQCTWICSNESSFVYCPRLMGSLSLIWSPYRIMLPLASEPVTKSDHFQSVHELGCPADYAVVLGLGDDRIRGPCAVQLTADRFSSQSGLLGMTVVHICNDTLVRSNGALRFWHPPVAAHCNHWIWREEMSWQVTTWRPLLRSTNSARNRAES